MNLIKHTDVQRSSGSLLLLLPFICLILFINIIRFTGLDHSPPGFHVDELAGACAVQCLATEKMDILGKPYPPGKPYPLFADFGYGSPKPPTTFYFTVLWTKLFGFSIVAFRSASAFMTIVAIAGLAALSCQLFGVRSAVYVLFTASLSPWVFQLSRLSLDGGMAIVCLVWGMFFFLRSSKNLDAVFAGIFLALAMYSYPSTRLHVPLILGPLLYLKTRRHPVTKPFMVVGILMMLITGIPLIRGVLNGSQMGRFGLIGIFSESFLESVGKSKTIPDLMGIFFKHFGLHLSPDFLIFKGDKNFVYGTGFTGLLGWVDTLILGAGMVWLVVRTGMSRGQIFVSKGIDRDYLLFLIFAMAAAIVPSALTWQDLPHSMRIIGMWPFVSLLTGYVLWRLCAQFRYVWIVPFAAALLFCQMYMTHYFTVYPAHAYWMFSAIAEDRARAARTDEDWLKFVYIYRKQNFHAQYYMMNYMNGQTCSSAMAIWDQVHKIK